MTYQLHKSLVECVKARIDTIHFIPATVRRSQQKRVWIQVPARYQHVLVSNGKKVTNSVRGVMKMEMRGRRCGNERREGRQCRHAFR